MRRAPRVVTTDDTLVDAKRVPRRDFPIPPEQLAGLTYGSVTKEQDAATRASYGFWEIVHTGVILAIIAGIYICCW